jgi:hypothetical protein
MKGVLKFTHANLNREIFINEPQLFAWYWSPEHKATFLLSAGTTTIPIKESVSEVEKQVLECKHEGSVRNTSESSGGGA